MKKIKTCNVCGKLLRDYNKSGLCARHLSYKNRGILKAKKRLEFKSVPISDDKLVKKIIRNLHSEIFSPLKNDKKLLNTL